MMNRRDMLKSTAALVGATAFPVGWTHAADAKEPQKVLYFTRNGGFYHSVVKRKNADTPSHSEKIMVELGKKNGFEVTLSKDGRIFDGDIDQYDAFIFYCNNDLTKPNKSKEPPMTVKGKKRFMDAVARGKGFVGLHSTCACFRTAGAKDKNAEKVDPFIAMLGGEFIAHGPQQEATLRITSPGFPGVKGLGEAFKLREEWYAMKNFATDLHVILVQETAGMKGGCYQRPPFPSTWARRHGKGRVYFNSMAHREDVWLGQPFQQVLLGGIAWACRNVEVDVTPNVAQAAPKAWELTNKKG